VKKTGNKQYSTLPFIAGTANRNSTQYNPIVEAALWQLADEDPNFHVADFSDCTLGSDNLHFNAEGNVTCATRMFNQLVNLGIVESDTIAVSQAPADTLRLTKAVVTNYDFEFYSSSNGVLLNDGTERLSGEAPFGWQHTWTGYPETNFPSSTNPPTYGITGTSSTINGKSYAFYKPKGAMPENFELFQEIPAGQLPPGRYRLSCLMGQNVIKAGVTRLFANSQVQYFGMKARYTAEKLKELFPNEIITFAGNTGSSLEELHEMSVTFTLSENEPLRFGIRSSNLNTRGATTAINETGAFSTDYWRLVRLGDTTEVSSPMTRIWNSTVGTFDLCGRQIENPSQGIFISKGKKTLFR